MTEKTRWPTCCDAMIQRLRKAAGCVISKSNFCGYSIKWIFLNPLKNSISPLVGKQHLGREITGRFTQICDDSDAAVGSSSDRDIYIYIHTYIYVNTYMCIYVYTYIYVYIYVYICIYIYSIYTHTYICIYMCIYTYIHIYIYVYIYLCVYICVYIYTYIHTHIYMCVYMYLCLKCLWQYLIFFFKDESEQNNSFV